MSLRHNVTARCSIVRLNAYLCSPHFRPFTNIDPSTTPLLKVSLVSDLAFEYLTELHLMVSCMGRTAASDADWNTYLDAMRSVLQGDSLFRALVVTDGGYPTRSQQGRMTAFVGKRTPCVAVISSSTAMRFVVSILALLNSKVSCFDPSQRHQAYSYLGLSPSQNATVDAAVERQRLVLSAAANAKVA